MQGRLQARNSDTVERQQILQEAGLRPHNCLHSGVKNINQ